MASQIRSIERAAAKADGLKPVERVLLLGDGIPRVMKRDFNAVAEAEVLMGGFEAAAAGEDALRRLGNLNVLAQWLYALTASHREDHEDPITYKSFRRLLPTETEELQALAALVTAVMNPPGVQEVQGNAPEPDASEPATAESTGSGTTTSGPSSSDATTENSGG